MTLPRLGATLALAVACSAALVVPSAAAHAPRAAITRATTVDIGDPAYPVLVPLDAAPVSMDFGVSTDGRTTVSAVASGDAGLTITDPVQSKTTISEIHSDAQGAGFTFHVAATTPGVHQLSVTFTADGTQVVVTLPHVVAAGSTLVDGHDSLAGRTYAYSRGFAALHSGMLTFVDGRYAYVGLPLAGRPTCSHPTAHCLRYSYDKRSGLFQVGTGIVGKVVGRGIYTDGWAAPYPQEQTGKELTERPLTYAPKGTRLAGRWAFTRPSSSVTFSERLLLRKDGTYRLSYRDAPSSPRTRSTGTYRLTRAGRVVLTAHGRVFATGTLALVGAKNGAPEPNRFGVWFGLGGAQPHGTLLDPAKGT